MDNDIRKARLELAALDAAAKGHTQMVTREFLAAVVTCIGPLLVELENGRAPIRSDLRLRG